MFAYFILCISGTICEVTLPPVLPELGPECVFSLLQYRITVKLTSGELSGIFNTLYGIAGLSAVQHWDY